MSAHLNLQIVGVTILIAVRLLKLIERRRVNRVNRALTQPKDSEND